MAGADTRPPCRFYQVGQCRAGSICKFAHVKDSTNKLKIAAPCKFFFNQGYCAHGDRCAFSHVKKAEPPRAAAPVPARRAPPPAAAAAPAPPPAPRSPTIQEKLQRVRAKLELDDALPMVKAIEKANAAAGLTAEGPLPAQVDRLLAALHLDDAAPAPAPPPPSSWAGAAASGLKEDTPPSPSALSADAVAFKPAAGAAVTDDGTGFVATSVESGAIVELKVMGKGMELSVSSSAARFIVEYSCTPKSGGCMDSFATNLTKCSYSTALRFSCEEEYDEA